MILKKYSWLFPVIGGLITLIGVSTPIASMMNLFQVWMWGLVVTRFLDISVDFIKDPVLLNIGIICSIILLVFSLILIITGYFYKRGYFNNYIISKIWISCGVGILPATIVPLVTFDFYVYDPFFFNGLWTFCDPGFGAIGPIAGGVIAIVIGVLVLTSRAGRKQVPVPISVAAPKNTCPHCGRAISLNASFCSKCGKTIKKNDVNKSAV